MLYRFGLFGLACWLLAFWGTMMSIPVLAQQSVVADFYSFPHPENDTSQGLFTLSVPANALNYEEEEGKFSGGFNYQLELFHDSVRTHLMKDTIPLKSLPEEASAYIINVLRRLDLPRTAYLWRLQLQDQLSGEQMSATGEMQVNHIEKKGALGSTIFLEKAIKTKTKGADVRQGYQLLIINDDFFPPERQRVGLYNEWVSQDTLTQFFAQYELFNSQDELVYQHLQALPKQKVVPLLHVLPLDSFPSGDYLLQIAVNQGGADQVLDQSRKAFSLSNPAKDEDLRVHKRESFEEMLDSIKTDRLVFLMQNMTVIGTDRESATLESVSSLERSVMENYFLEFWQRRNKENPGKPFGVFLERVNTVEKRYAMGERPGYLSERGRVFLQNGPPDQVFDQYTDTKRSAMDQNKLYPYEIWKYWHLDKWSQSNVEYVFLQGELGNSYRLVHSDARGEYHNPEWRKTLYKAHPNMDYTDPNDRQSAEDNWGW